MQAVLREPLLWFFAVAGLLFALGVHTRSAPAEVSVGQVEAALAARLGRMPTEAERAAELEEASIREALVLEARRLDLADDDPIVRRRLVQKMELLAEDLATLDPPDEAALAAQLAAHPERYRRAERRTVRQVFLPEGADAQDVLRRLAAGAAPGRLGGPFVGGLDFTLHTEAELARRVSAPVARAAFEAAPGVWVGPVGSVHGRHLLLVEAVAPGGPASLDEVRAEVRRDLEVARRDEARAAVRRRALRLHPVVVTE